MPGLARRGAPSKQTFTVAAHDLAKHVQGLIAEGNVRRIVIRQDAWVVAAIPLTVGVVGALAALVADCAIEIVHEETHAEPS